MVVPTDPELVELVDQFVCVRLVQMGGVDLATFQFDPHVSWALFFMHADKTIYGRYGRAHPETKRSQKDSNPTPSLAGIKAALSRALEVHAGYATDSEKWAPALAGKTGPEPEWRFAEKTPAALQYKRLKRIDGGGEGCVHCHEVHRTAVDSLFLKKKPIPDNMLWLYPRPEVIGLSLDKDHCARVVGVADGSFAATAGLQSGDDILSLNAQPLVSIADVQWVLHGFADEGGALPAEVRRGDKTVALTLQLPDGWRRAEDFAWRYRTFGYAQWLWAGVDLEDDAGGIRVKARAPQWFKRENQDGKRALVPGDVILEVDGRLGLDRSGLIAYLMREKKLGSKLKLTIVRNGERKDVDFKMPKKQPEVLGY